jgi:exodeoxyribonuclease VII small subunit
MNEPDFETALRELEEIVRQLELGQAPLDESLGLFERGVGLLKHCRSALNQAELRLSQLTSVDEAGNIQLSDFAHRPAYDRE